jgi:hypothetical protein
MRENRTSGSVRGCWATGIPTAEVAHVMIDESPKGRPMVLPHTEICQAKDIGIDQFAECLVEHPLGCKYALAFGYGFFWWHSNRKEII